MLNVAVVGSGPAGLYTAEALVKQAAALDVQVQVDVLDRLPTPYGLVRYGGAPDHQSIKSIAQYLRKVLESPDVRFVGGVHLGSGRGGPGGPFPPGEGSRDDLVSAYDAVVYAPGGMRVRRLSIDGEALPGSFAATDFVNWYCGHPDVDPSAFVLDAESVAVIGVGNVAVDVARILAREPSSLHATDVPQPVLEALHASKVREVHMIGRRGPAHAKFTTKELRELGELPGVEIVVHADEADLNTFDLAGEGTALVASDRRVRGNMVAISRWGSGASPAAAGGRRPPRADDGSRCGSGCGRWRSSGRTGSRASPSSGPGWMRTVPFPARAPWRPLMRRWCSGRSGTRACRCLACRSTPGRTWCRTRLAGSSVRTARRCPVSTWRGGSSAGRPVSSALTSRTRRRPCAPCSRTWCPAPMLVRCRAPGCSGTVNRLVTVLPPGSRRWPRCSARAG